MVKYEAPDEYSYNDRIYSYTLDSVDGYDKLVGDSMSSYSRDTFVKLSVSVSALTLITFASDWLYVPIVVCPPSMNALIHCFFL